MTKKWGILIKKESESLIVTGLKIPRDYFMEREAKRTMREKLREKIGNTLESLASDIPMETGCSFLWGEVEVPECLRKELEQPEE